MRSPSFRTLLISVVALASLYYGLRAFTTKSAPLIMSTKSIIESAITDNKVVLFSKSYCPYCKKAKSIFVDLAEPAKVFELDQMEDGAEYQAYLTQKTGQRTVPFVFVKEQFLGGSSDVEAKLRSGELKKLLA